MIFHKQRRNNPLFGLVLLGLLMASMFVLKGIMTEQIKSPFLPTPIPTRSASSYALEGDSHFQAGSLEKAIEVYQNAVTLDPNNINLRSELARIQVYSSASMTSDADQLQRLQEAEVVIQKAVEINPDDSKARAVHSLVLDWLASNSLVSKDESAGYMATAEEEANRARFLDNRNALALAYYAEILTDQQKLAQAYQYIDQAVAIDNSLMDVHRVRAYVLESSGEYGEAIKEYDQAIQLTPALTFLYVRAGLNYRRLEQFTVSLKYFGQAVRINEQLGIIDPIPYIAASKSYGQMGNYRAAALNMEEALRINPTNADVYGQLGITYKQDKNYEGAIMALKCAVKGCSADETCEIRQCDSETDDPITISALPLTNTTVVYYFQYGAILAALHTRTRDYCTEAVSVLEEVRAFSTEPVVLQIVDDSEAICASYNIVP